MPSTSSRETGTGRLSALVVAGEDGQRYDLVSTGGTGDGRRASFTAILRPAPPPTTTSLLIGPTEDGQLLPVALAPPPTIAIGPVEPLHPVPAGERWLRAQAEVALFDYLRGRRRDPELDLNICIDTLVAVDAVDPHDDVVTDVRNLLAVLHGTHPPDDLPSQWKNVLASRGHDQHWDATAVLAVILPSLGGVTVALEGLQIRRGNAALSVELTPYDTAWYPTGEPKNITVRAVDNRGGRYLARQFWASGSDHHAEAGYSFVPPLDPALRRLRLQISAETHTCTAEIDLPPSPVPT